MTPAARGDLVPVAICADDYAIAGGVDEAILALAVQGRISALSCMTASPRWPQAAPRLKPLFGKLDLGLHFTLTQLAPLGAMATLAPGGRLPGMAALYLRSTLRRIDLDEVSSEFERQLDAFAQATGRAPDFLDGHHHAHQLPGIRDRVVQAWRTRRLRGWIRNTAADPASPGPRRIAPLRANVLSRIGRAAARTWREAGIATNQGFAGVRSFREREAFGELMRGWLAGAGPGHLVMCHPGYPDEELARLDRVNATRGEELEYLSSGDFPADLAAAGCRLVRLSAIAGR